MQFYNTEFLIRIEVNDSYESRRYVYKPFKRGNFWRSEQKEGIYDTLLDYLVNDDNFLEIRDKTVYRRPNVKLCYLDKSKITYVFDTFEQAKEFAAKFTVNEKWIR